MWIKVNPNPAKKQVPDCVIRAICIAFHKPWLEVFDELSALARSEFSVPVDDNIWGEYLYLHGFSQFLLPHECPRCITIKQFCSLYPKGVYIIGTGSHAVTVIDGNYYDSWDSGNEIPTFFWRYCAK